MTSPDSVLMRFEGRVLKSFFEAAHELSDGEAHMTVSSEAGVELSLLDPSHVALMTCAVKSKEFLEIVGSGAFDIKVSLFFTFFRKVKADEIVAIDFVDGVFRACVSRKGRLREETIRVYDFADRKKKLPELTYTAHLKAPVDVFEDLFSADTISQKLTLKERTVICEGMDQGTAIVKTTLTSDEQTSFFNGEGKSFYPTDYLAHALTAMKKFDADEKVEMSFKTDYPCMISSMNDSREVRVVIAPRTEL